MNLKTIKNIELLAPARDFATAMAAIDYGADAVYMGASRFGARYAAGNSTDDIALAASYAHKYGARVYATLNTILFEDELEEAHKTAIELVSAGVDALIIQDMAYLEMGIKGVEFHASTQVFNAEPSRVRFLEECGITRAILERGLTLKQIEAIRAATNIELEAFVHGAICVCYSGRCYMSRSTGLRSGNRGECSQPCRLTYDLLDGDMQPVIRGKHLLSVKDLDLSERIGDMLDSGISSFKIEGRLKDVSYVRNCVNYYRRRIDSELSARTGMHRSSNGITITDITPDLSKSFTRGRSEYFFDGLKCGVASFDTPKALGEPLGKLKASGRGWIELDSTVIVSAQDGICFFISGELAGTKINKVEGKRLYTDKDFPITKGSEIYRNHDNRFDRELATSRTRRVIDASAEVCVTAERATIIYRDSQGFTACAETEGRFEPARDAAKIDSTIREQAAKSGDTIFRITETTVSMPDGAMFVPVSVLAALRRRALDDLLAQRLFSPPKMNIPLVLNHSYPYPKDNVGSDENVTNSLAKRFYERHGVKNIADGLDMKPSMSGETVMRTPYCIRREIGECLKENPRLPGKLYLKRGSYLYSLEFDCKACLMSIVAK